MSAGEQIDAAAFVLEAVSQGIGASMADVMGRFDCGHDLVTAIGYRTHEAARLLTNSVVLNLGDFWQVGDLQGTRDKIAAVARAQLAALIADAISNFIAADDKYVH